MAKTPEELEAENIELQKELKALKNKGLGIEVEREKRKELEAKLEKIEEAEKKVKEDKLKEDNKLKELLDGKDTELEAIKQSNKDKDAELETLRKNKEDFDENQKKLCENAINDLPEDKREFVKGMAEKHDISERLSFITDFSKQFIIAEGSLEKGGKINKNGENKTEMEKAKTMFNELEIKQNKTSEEKRKLTILGKIISGKLPLGAKT